MSSVAFSPDGRYLASGSKDQTVRIWNPATGRPIGSLLAANYSEVSSVTFSPDSRRLAASGFGVWLWDTATGKPVDAPPDDHTGKVTSVAFSPDGQRLASAGEDGTVRIWDVASPSDLGNAVCAIADRGFTRHEWQQYIPDAPYHPTCPAARKRPPQ